MLAIESAPGLGKSSTIESALQVMGAKYRSVGSYSTALHLYNTLSSATPNEILILDDCAGLFTNDVSMAILKGATWASAGHGGERRVRWGSTTALKTMDEFAFQGKLILIANHIPRGEDTKAFLQRVAAVCLCGLDYQNVRMPNGIPLRTACRDSRPILAVIRQGTWIPIVHRP